MVKLDGNLQPFSVPQLEDVDVDVPTTFVIDDFDDVLETGDTQVFNHLRSIRDKFKYHVTFLLISNRSVDLTQYLETLGSFYELVTESEIFFPACTKSETDMVIDTIINKYSDARKNFENSIEKYGDENQVREMIWNYSGGIPSLVKSWLMYNDNSIVISNRVKGLVQRIYS